MNVSPPFLLRSGASLPKICVALAGASAAELARHSAALLHEFPFQEFRLDYLPDPASSLDELRGHIQARRAGIFLATCRTEASGGHFTAAPAAELARPARSRACRIPTHRPQPRKRRSARPARGCRTPKRWRRGHPQLARLPPNRQPRGRARPHALVHPGPVQDRPHRKFPRRQPRALPPPSVRPKPRRTSHRRRLHGRTRPPYPSARTLERFSVYVRLRAHKPGHRARPSRRPHSPRPVPHRRDQPGHKDLRRRRRAHPLLALATHAEHGVRAPQPRRRLPSAAHTRTPKSSSNSPASCRFKASASPCR